MSQTVREPEPPVAATTSPAAGKESPINNHTNEPRRRAEAQKVADKSLRWPVDTASMAGIGEKPCTSDTSQRERKNVVRRASASTATAATPASSSSRAGSIVRRASASHATTSTPASSYGAGFFGSFDDSRYWDYAFRFTQRQDIGNKCRECKRPFLALQEEIVVRRYSKSPFFGET